ncbi:MAG: c-type cytochrome [Anaerolineae bacterium]
MLVVALLLAACDSTPGPLATPYPTVAGPLATLTPGSPARADNVPPNRPSAGRGAALYGPNCASCHGDSGRGDTALARALSPRPANFHDVEFMRSRTPLSLYHSITKGVLGSGMLAFDGKLTEQERWDVLFYVWSLHTSDEDLAKGRSLYEQNCASCHGASGQGATASSLTDPATMLARTGRSLAASLNGLPADPQHHFDTLSDADRWAIVEYLWTFMYDR